MTNLEQIRSKIFGSEPFLSFLRGIGGLTPTEPIYIRGVHGSLVAFLAALASEKFSQVLLVVPGEDQAEELRDDCSVLLGDRITCLFGPSPPPQVQLLEMDSAVERVEALQALSSDDQVVVVSSAQGIAGKIPGPHQFRKGILTVETGKTQAFGGFLEKLVKMGFEKKDFVEDYGDFAVRGGIVDVFAFVGENPVRIEFWGDSVESIREFDRFSQRSIRQLQSASIMPGLAKEAESLLFDHLSEDALIILYEPELIQKEVEEVFTEGAPNAASWEDIQASLSNYRRVIHSSFAANALPALDFRSSPQPASNGSIKLLYEQIANFQQVQLYLSCDTDEEAARLKELLDLESANRNHTVEYNLIPQGFHSGFVFPAAKIVMFTEHQVFGRRKRRGRARKKTFAGMSQKELHQLKRGDYVVHVDYGIGKFFGLQKIKVRGVEQEVVKVLYAENDVLYVNLNFINRIQKYSSREGHVPALTKLGSPDWERLKSRVRKKIKDIARDLIKLYARRKHEQGFSFAQDTAWQKEMEASFMYEDTPDQAKATAEVKKDMESPSPMDRLVCGDVGFGKTEVAVRAAFKSVMDGKQAAVLVPTTILAQQHFNTFLDRLGRYSVRIESLSRFRSKKEQQNILEGLQSGHIDIVIGTQRLLSKDVHFKDLGLLVIDEEHRFGVSAKEKLRQLRASVDTLTLTATPIPRTLQFSLMGARDLSLINTPPRNRLPIITEIAPFDLGLIREAILKEVHRGGQAYFIHDRIQNIEDVQALLEEHVPEARFHIAHGQMKGHQLERTMLDFLEKKYDVLICTKIIESGIDIPSVNTIIINRADRFGLAELYQLRGRVGRSNVRAFAYLLTPPISTLPKDTLRRLQAIQDFTELGSGFSLAMRDLEIRGAGNLLGSEQTGFIEQMGFEMYQRILEQAVSELKEEEFGREVPRVRKEETIVEADIDAYIPDFYVESDAERFDIYRRLYKSQSRAEIDDLRQELHDRFGEYPSEVENLFQLVELKILAAALGFMKLDLAKGKLGLTLPPADVKEFYEGKDGQEAPFQRMMARVSSMKQYSIQLKQREKELRLEVSLNSNDGLINRIGLATDFLESLAMHG
jgi:transcription-repair coupling factor (superfamily II helicase)